MPFSQYPVAPSSLSGVHFPDILAMDPFHPTNEGFTQAPKSPGTRCPTCAAEGSEVWVIPGRSCSYCGTPCDHEHIHD